MPMPLSKEFWEKRANRLFSEWDACEDPYSLPLAEFKGLHAKVEQACTITMMLDTMDAEIDKAKKEKII